MFSRSGLVTQPAPHCPSHHFFRFCCCCRFCFGKLTLSVRSPFNQSVVTERVISMLVSPTDDHEAKKLPVAKTPKRKKVKAKRRKVSLFFILFLGCGPIVCRSMCQICQLVTTYDEQRFDMFVLLLQWKCERLRRRCCCDVHNY